MVGKQHTLNSLVEAAVASFAQLGVGRGAVV